MSRQTKLKILIVGPTAGLGGVRTHVKQLVKIFDKDSFELKIIRGNSTLENIMTNLRLKPDAVIHNLSVYKKELFRIVFNRYLFSAYNAKHILHLHGGKFCELGFLHHPVIVKMLVYHFRRYDRIFCLTNEQYKTISSFIKNKDSIQEIFNYVEIPRKNEIIKENKKLNLLFLGRLTKAKGLLDAMEAVKKIKSDKLILWVVGEGELNSKFLKNSDPRIRFVGKKNDIEKKKYLQKADIFIFPSSWPEGLPYAMLEAAAYGAALISTNVGSIDKILINEVNGFFVDPGNINMLTTIIQKFLDNPELSNKMGQESYKRCKHLFSIEHLKKIYQKMFIEWEFDKKC